MTRDYENTQLETNTTMLVFTYIQYFTVEL